MNEKLMELINMTDADFYDQYISKLPLEEQAEFFEEFTEFLNAAGDDRIKEQLSDIHERILEGHTRM